MSDTLISSKLAKKIKEAFTVSCMNWTSIINSSINLFNFHNSTNTFIKKLNKNKLPAISPVSFNYQVNSVLGYKKIYIKKLC